MLEQLYFQCCCQTMCSVTGFIRLFIPTKTGFGLEVKSRAVAEAINYKTMLTLSKTGRMYLIA